jgi:predicted dehydrogenase
MIRFGIVGTGQMATNMMAAFRHLPNAKVIAVSSITKGRAKEFAKKNDIATFYPSIEDMLASPSVDAIYIASSNENHVNFSMQALRSGKSVLCEKPIATSAIQAEELEAVASKTGKLCMEAIWTHFLPAYERLFQLNNDQSLGKAMHLNADFGYPLSYPNSSSNNSAICGVLRDRGIYPVALAIKLFGSVAKVDCVLKYDECRVENHASLLLHHHAGIESQLTTSFVSLLQNRACLSFENGSVTIEPPLIGAEAITLKLDTATQQSKDRLYGLEARLKARLKEWPVIRNLNSRRSLGLREFHSYGANQYVPMLKHFCALHTSEIQQSDVVPLSQSIAVQRVLDLAILAASDHKLNLV